jgi:hypothetical protein
MNIESWLNKFKEAWQNHDIKEVMSLFQKELTYFETPFHKINNLEDLTKEWQIVKSQRNIQLDYQIFSSHQNRHSIIWKLSYRDKNNAPKEFAGTYLIELNDQGLCTYFHHTCQTKH